MQEKKPMEGKVLKGYLKAPLIPLRNIYNGLGVVSVTASMLVANAPLRDWVAYLGSQALFVAGMGGMGATELGLTTVNAYVRTLNRYQRFGKINDSFLRYYYNSDYCWRRGVELAMQEIGLSEQWEKIKKEEEAKETAKIQKSPK